MRIWTINHIYTILYSIYHNTRTEHIDNIRGIFEASLVLYKKQHHKPRFNPPRDCPQPKGWCLCVAEGAFTAHRRKPRISPWNMTGFLPSLRHHLAIIYIGTPYPSSIWPPHYLESKAGTKKSSLHFFLGKVSFVVSRIQRDDVCRLGDRVIACSVRVYYDYRRIHLYPYHLHRTSQIERSYN